MRSLQLISWLLMCQERAMGIGLRKKSTVQKNIQHTASGLHDLGVNEPRIVYGPRNFTGFNASEFADKAFELWTEGEWGYLHRSQTGAQPAIMSGSISVAFSATWDAFQNYSHILDFGQDWDGNNVVVGNHLQTSAISFHSYDDRQNYWLNLDNTITKGANARYLCTMTSDGHYYVYREGELIGDFKPGHPVSPVPRPHMYIGKSFWSWDGLFQGHISKVCIWNYTMSWDDSLTSCPRNKPGQQGTPTGLSFDPAEGAKLVINNLGGLASSSQPPIMRWEGVGAMPNGKKIDLVVKVLGPYVQASKKTTRQGLVGEQYMGIVMKYGSKTELIFQFMEHKTNTPVIVKNFFFTVMDIDELFAARELMRVSDYDNFFLWRGNDTNMTMYYDHFGRTVFSSEPGAGGRFWDNPGKINKQKPVGVVSKKGKYVDQRSRLVCFAYKMRSAWRMSFEAPLLKKLSAKASDHNRNFVFTFNPKWDWLEKDYGFWGWHIEQYHARAVPVQPIINSP